MSLIVSNETSNLGTSSHQEDVNSPENIKNNVEIKSERPEKLQDVAQEQPATVVDLSDEAKTLIARAKEGLEVADFLRERLEASKEDQQPSVLNGTDASDIIDIQAHYAEITGGAGDDKISTYDYAEVDGGDGDDVIDTYGHSTVSGGAGDDTISTYDYSTVDGGDGNDVIETNGYAQIDGGRGDDVISTYDNSTVTGGAGNDTISANDNAQVDGGSGNDTISVYENAQVTGGDGNDVISAYSHSKLDGGAGNDVIDAYDYSQVTAGSGNDSVSTYDHSTVDGGEGNDQISVGAYSTVTGGQGNDLIELRAENTIVNYNKGDGSDVIRASEDFTLNIGGGYTKDDVSVVNHDGKAIVSFKGSDDTIVLDLDSTAKVQLSFADNATIDVSV